MTDHRDTPTMLVTLAGDDHPGVTGALFNTLAESECDVLDVEQVVVRGRLTLATLVTAPTDARAESVLRDHIRRIADAQGMTATIGIGRGDSRRPRTGRAAVVVLGAPLRPAAVASVANRIASHGANIDRIQRLARHPVTAVELDCSGADVPALRRELALVSHDEGVDISVAPGGLARIGRRLVVMDVDSTLIQDEVIELLASEAGREAEVAAITESAMRGELDFAESLHARVATLEGLPEAVLERTRRRVRLTPGARTLVSTFHSLGMTVAVVSGGFIEIVEAIAADLGIDRAVANRLEIADGRLTGRVTGRIIDRAAKADALRELAAAEGLPLSRTVAIGDGANDLDMLEAAGMGVAFNAKPVVRERADTSVSVPYLDSVLFLLGITPDEADNGVMAASCD
ncbi:MAG: phosphoserine phosphatase SerB [Thermoleophilia bacterium]|nr:phosphoserine phosphatase SerB [Thermoleophilia bacterium]